ncbi:MAG: hypothetical protein WC742_02870 [Gallionellaceae bacterium]|jgi:hypothetical protein
MQIHQSVAHGLLYSVSAQDFAQLNLSVAAHDDFDWEAYESEYTQETLANNVLEFLREVAGRKLKR